MGWRLLFPMVGFGKWCGDGLHDETTVDGRVIEFAWLGLHFEIVAALERPSPARRALDGRRALIPGRRGDNVDLFFGLLIGFGLVGSGALYIADDAWQLGALIVGMGVLLITATTVQRLRGR